MKQAVIILGMAKRLPAITGDVIGVDRGAWIAAQQGISMVMAIGDFDSVSEREFELLKRYAQAIHILPKEKDETDTEAALSYAMKAGYDCVDVYGGLGGRLDHELANLRLLERGDLSMTLYDEHNRITRLPSGIHRLKKDCYPYISFLALTDDTRITLKQVKYPLDYAVLNRRDVYTVSNEMVADEMTAEVSKAVLVIQSADDTQ